jgi:hypothetical protein
MRLHLRLLNIAVYENYIQKLQGFGDPNIKEEEILDQFRNGVEAANNEIDCVLFFLKKNRFKQEDVNFFHFFQDIILLGRCKKNSILIMTNCEKGWLAKDEQKLNKDLQKIIENCDGQTYEFRLRLDDKNEDDDEDLKKNITKREKSIKELNEFLEGKTFDKISLEYVQTEQFKKFWFKQVMPVLGKLLKSPSPIVNVCLAPVKFVAKAIYNSYKDKKNKILFIGLPDSGKHLIANFIYSNYFQSEFHASSPFKANPESNVHFGNHEIVLMNTVDFDHPEFYNQLKDSCKLTSNQFDWIVFVVHLENTNSPINTKFKALFQNFQNDFLKNKGSQNSILIITTNNLTSGDVDKFVEQQKTADNEFISILDNCQKYFHHDLNNFSRSDRTIYNFLKEKPKSVELSFSA